MKPRKSPLKVGERVRCYTMDGPFVGKVTSVGENCITAQNRDVIVSVHPRQCVRLVPKKPCPPQGEETKRMERWMNIVNVGFGHNAFYATENEARAVAAQNYPACTTTVHLVELRKGEIAISMESLEEAWNRAMPPLWKTPHLLFDELCKALGLHESKEKA